MKLPELKVPTKVEVEVSRQYRREVEVWRDIQKIDTLTNVYDSNQ